MLTKLINKNEKGFTLIELMIVIAIIGILAAIAIPQFSAYRMRAYNASAQSDLKNLTTSEAAFFSDWQVYGKSEGVAAPGAGGFLAGVMLIGPSTPTNAIITVTAQGAARGMQVGLGNGVRLVASTDATGASFTSIAKHDKGNAGYGTDGDITSMFTDPTTWGAGVVIAAGNEPASTTTDDFTGVGAWIVK